MRRTRYRPFVLLAALMLVVTAVGPAGAQTDAGTELRSLKAVQRSDYNSYIVIMKADPLVVSEGEDLGTGRAQARANELKASHAKALGNAGIAADKKLNEYVTALNGFSAQITYAEAVKLAGDPEVALVLPDELRQPQTDSSGAFLGLAGDGDAWDTGVTGKGVVVGIIDTGIWPEHPSFADNGLPAPPTGPLPCEFGDTAHNVNDAPFSCNNKLIGARQMLATYRTLIGAAPDEFNSARDDNGHGTHTASTAAGNAGVVATMYGESVGAGPISGIAPDAHVIAYKGLGNLGGFSSDLAAAIDQAVEDGVDVINYSIGGGGVTISADELSFLFAADAGVHVASSAGNTGPGAATVRNPAKVPWLTTVGANTQGRFIAGTLALGNGTTYEGASITLGTDGVYPIVDAATAAPGTNGDLCISTATGTSKLDPAVVAGKIVLCRRGANARVDKSLAVLQAGGVGMVLYENNDINNLYTDSHWVPSVHVDNTPGLAIKAYIASAGAGATAEIRDTQRISTWPVAPSMTNFSSRGQNVFPDVIKPDVTAPGFQILAGNSPFPDAGTVPGELFQAIAGTSMSSPHVAGLFALLEQAHPDWSPAAARSALMTTADPNVFDHTRTTLATPFGMGAGQVDPGKVVARGSAFQPGLVYDAGFLDYLGFLCEAFPAVFANPAATCAFLAGAGIPTDAADLNYPSIAVSDVAGARTVTRTVTSVATEAAARTYTVAVQAPSGYSVSVSPSTITLKRGQSATYEVTFTNSTGPVGEWRFGDLTWTSNLGKGVQYAVRSPIAVRAAAFIAPTFVNGSGSTGSTSFDVAFGYTGAYAAVPHGLVPATVTHDNVLQDADQTFSPSDAGTGGANEHQFNLSGAAVFRIAMPPEATEANADLDIFVYNPSGVQVASSTAGGTDELITISNPADGTWKVYVHGWAAPGGDSDYDLYTWAIPSASGGSLVVDSAPASATIATAGTIQLSWSGATTGQWHFGAVSHVGDGGAVLGRTLVQVDNR